MKRKREWKCPRCNEATYIVEEKKRDGNIYDIAETCVKCKWVVSFGGDWMGEDY